MSGGAGARRRIDIDRGTLATRTRSVLSRGGWGNADVLLVETETGPVVVKDFAPRGAWLRRRRPFPFRASRAIGPCQAMHP